MCLGEDDIVLLPPLSTLSPASSPSIASSTSDSLFLGCEMPLEAGIDANYFTEESSSLRNTRQLLDANDSILEPGLWATVAEFVRHGGDSGEVPFLLARGLIGYPQMARLLVHWLGIAGVSQVEVEAITWDAVEKELKRRLDVCSLDDSTVQWLVSRPKFLNTLLEKRQGRCLVVDLYSDTSRQGNGSQSDLLCHCLREIAARGHISELLELDRICLCDDWYLFKAGLLSSVMRAAKPNRSCASSVETLVTDILRCCGARLEAQCYANRVLETIECAAGTKDPLLWRYARQDKRLVIKPPLLRLLHGPLRAPCANALGDLVLSLARNPTVTALDAVRTAYNAMPHTAYLRVPQVAAALFQLAFDPTLAIPHSIDAAADLIAAAVSIPSKTGDGLGLANTSDCICATHAATAAVIATAAKTCLHETLSTYGHASTGDILLAAACRCAAARHGILVWIAKLLEDPSWLRTRLRSFASSALLILRTAARSPHAQRRVFNAYKRIVDAPRYLVAQLRNARVSEPYDSNDVSKAAIVGLVDLAADWSCAPDIVHFAKVSDSIHGTLLKHFVLRLGKKTRPPYSVAFATAAADLLGCEKARHVWRRLDTLPTNEIANIRSLASGIASRLQDIPDDGTRAYLTRLGTASGQIAVALPKFISTVDSFQSSLMPESKESGSSLIDTEPFTFSRTQLNDTNPPEVRAGKRRASDHTPKCVEKRYRAAEP